MSLQPFPSVIRSRAVVLSGDNIDTDVITPIKRVVQGGEALIKYAFEPLRFAPDGVALPNDPFADQARQGAQILIAGENFGCGSSRETAAFAVRGMGFRVVLAPSFGDIFYSNGLKNGLLPIRLDASAFTLAKQAGECLEELEVELGAQLLWAGGRTFDFEIGALQKDMLLQGLDDLGLMHTRAAHKVCFDEEDAKLRPWVRNRNRV